MKTSLPRFLLLLSVWGLAATAAGVFHFLALLPPVAVSLLIAGLTVGLTLAVARVPWINEAVRTIGVRGLIAVHVARFLGIYFLWLQTQGRIPVEFAQRAGWGDIAAALGALILVIGPAYLRRGWVLALWNVFGLVDLLVAVGTASWLSVTRPGSVIELAGLPLTLVPLWLVPMMLSNHLTLLRWSYLEKAGGTMAANGGVAAG